MTGVTRSRVRFAAALALVLAGGLVLAPAVAEPALAASGRLLTRADATYDVDLRGGVVRVTVEFSLTNDVPSDGSFDYAYRDLAWAIHPEAADVRARDEVGGLPVSTVAEDGYVEAGVRLRRDLRFGQTTALTLSWDLPGAPPRSDSAVRVGQAFAAFQLWAWGDAGSSAVTARVPAGFEVQAAGSRVATTAEGGATTLRAIGIREPDAFLVSVAAVRERAYTSDALVLPGDVELRIRSWPEDPAWRTTVADTLRDSMPDLRELVGLPWPLDGRLDITEVYAPLLEGYSGLFYTQEERIEISEELDAETIVHEASHAWFNPGLFLDRWIGEGLAETYTALVLSGLDGARRAPESPRADDLGRVDLADWTFPETVTDDTATRDQYGYNAAWFVVDELYREIGPERMRAVFRAADGDVIAYRGAGEPETVAVFDSWRRFLDLLVEVGGSTRADVLFRDLVVSPASDRELDARAAARARYEALLTAGGDWRPPYYVRAPLGSWAFGRALERIDEAAAVLELRGHVDVLAAALGVTPGDAFEAAYEAADRGFRAAEAAGQAQLDALAAIVRVVAAIEADVGPIEWLGLLGAAPAAHVDEATAAFEAGDLEGAETAAATAAAIVAGAPAAGRERLAIVVSGSGAVVLLAVAIRRRRRRPSPGIAVETGGSSAIAAAAGPAGGPQTYATLAAQQAGPPPGVDGAGGPAGGDDGGGGSGTAFWRSRRHPALMPIHRARPSWEILSGESADVYFARAERILEREGMDPVVTMEVFTRQSAILCGIDEAKNLLGHVLAEADPSDTVVEALDDGDEIASKEVVLRISARYRAFGLYETAILGMLAQSTGWATAAHEVVLAAAPEPVISFGARHVHPDITDVLDYAAIVGGCVGASTPAGARLAGLNPTGTMPHALVLIFGDTVEAARAFDRDLDPDVPRIVLVDTFKDEAEEALRVAEALGDRLYGIRLDTPSERGRVTPDLVLEVRARLDQAGHGAVRIVVSGGLTPDRIRYFKDAGAPVDSFAVGSYISGARPVDFTADLKEIDGRPIAKRGRIPGRTDSPRLRPVRLADWRDHGLG